MLEVNPDAFAREWITAWNKRDLEAVLAHFHEDADFNSPLVQKLGHGENGTVRGKEEMRRYWTAALAVNPDLRFRLNAVYGGGDAIVIAFTMQDGTRRAEVLAFDGPLVRSGYGTVAVGK